MTTTLLPEIEALCGDSETLAQAVHGQAQRLAGLAMLLTFGGPSSAYAHGWSPAHVLGWTPYVQAEMSATIRRASRDFLAAAA